MHIGGQEECMECIELFEKYNIPIEGSKINKEIRKMTLKYHPDKNINKTKKQREHYAEILSRINDCKGRIIDQDCVGKIRHRPR